jgi:uncharacterized protein (TIGR03089 family)
MHPGAATVVSALAKAVEQHPGRPLLTFYDGSTGERIELSAVSVDNWVNKIANLFSDQLMLDPDELVGLSLPPHWQAWVTLLGSWTAGLRVSLGEQLPADATVSVVGPAALASAVKAHGTVVACSLEPLGAPFRRPLPTGWLDFAREVPGQPDLLMAPAAVGPTTIALLSPSGPLAHGELAQQGRSLADGLGLGAGSRLLTDANPATPDGVVGALVAPLVAGASVVLAVSCDAAQRTEIATQERVTATAWVAGRADA